MTPTFALLLGALQGLTEFLPISSSGHLALAHHFFGAADPGSEQVAFDVVLHVATLLAVLLVYRHSLVALARAGFDAARSSGSYRRPRATIQSSDELRLVLALALGSLPTAVIGLLFQDRLESLFDRPAVVASMLLVTGALLSLPRLLGARAHEENVVRPWQAVLIGIVQGLAITPGISRSGSTISVALLLGIAPALAARFSFLLSIPAILGALLLKLGDLDFATTSGLELTLGFAAAFLVGWASLAVLLAMLRRGRFSLFAIYCFVLGSGVLAWLWIAP
ncbi:MAG TPA: undecaprenyl-diphosphate phosphatase [Thermoanaerobaculia bacterium]|nr:undecaprenyl-diphosphate phosphatase [Thermoanaerobaculia bacterium]